MSHMITGHWGRERKLARRRKPVLLANIGSQPDVVKTQTVADERTIPPSGGKGCLLHDIIRRIRKYRQPGVWQVGEPPREFRMVLDGS